MKKAIKFTLSLCIAMSLFSMTAFADFSAEFNEEKGGKFSITVNEPVDGEGYQIWVGNPGVSKDELADIYDDEDFMSSVRHVDFAMAKSADPITFEVDLSETEEYGTYAIRLIRSGIDIIENKYFKFRFIDGTLEDRAIEKFMGVESSEDLAEAVAEFSDESNEFIPKKDLSVLGDEDIVSSIGDEFVLVRDYKYPEGESFTTSADVVGCGEAAYAVSLLLGSYSADAAEKIEEYGSFISELIPQKKNAEATMKIVDATKKFIVDAKSLGEVLSKAKEYGAKANKETIEVFEKNKSKIKTFDDVEAVLKWSEVLGKLTSAGKRSEIEDIIEKNAEFLGVDTSENSHDGISLAKVAKRFDTNKAATLYGQDAFSKYYNSLAEEIAEEEEEKRDTGNSRKVSGGGGGALSSGKTIYPKTVEQVPINTDTEQQQDDASGLPFKDIDGCAWAHEYIRALYEKNIVKGVTEDTFEPDRPVTREEFVKMLVVAFVLQTDKNMIFDFKDVTIDVWSYPYIEAAYRGGIVRGKSADLFGRTDTITRQDAAVMISRIIGAESDEAPEFADAGSIAEYALAAVSGVSDRGIILGDADGNFNPTAVTTRAQAATIIARAIEGGNAE